MIGNKLTNYYINVYTCCSVVTASNGSRIKAKKKFKMKIKEKKVVDVDIHNTKMTLFQHYIKCRHSQYNFSLN